MAHELLVLSPRALLMACKLTRSLFERVRGDQHRTIRLRFSKRTSIGLLDLHTSVLLQLDNGHGQ